MHEETIAILFLAAAAASTIILTRYFYLKARHEERMFMIEKGVPIQESEPSRLWQRLWLRAGFLALGIGAGIFAGAFASQVLGMDEEVAFPALIFMLAGGSVFLSYVVELNMIDRRSPHDGERD